MSDPSLERVAALDLGTNTALLLVARRAADGGVEALEDHVRSPRLGEGLATTGRIAPAALERTIEALADHRRRLEELGVQEERRRAVGTAVLRRAADAADVLAVLRERTGFAVEVLSEEDEARLGFQAVCAGGLGDPARLLVVDVGGGSTEVVARQGSLRLSAPVGAVVLTEAYLGSGSRAPRRTGGWDALRAEARRAAEAFPAGAALGGPDGPKGPDGQVAVLGGTGTNLACLDLGLESFDPHRAEGHVVSAGACASWAEGLHALPLDERRRLPIEASRADILPAGLACLGAALERLGTPTARITGRGLRYGVVDEMLGPAGGPAARS